MGLISDLKRFGASVSGVSVSYRNKESGEAIRSVPIAGASLEVFTDRKLRNAAVAVAAKEIAFSATDMTGESQVSVSGKSPAPQVAASLASQAGDLEECHRFLLMMEIPGMLELERVSVQQQMQAANKVANEKRALLVKQLIADEIDRQDELAKQPVEQPVEVV